VKRDFSRRVKLKIELKLNNLNSILTWSTVTRKDGTEIKQPELILVTVDRDPSNPLCSSCNESHRCGLVATGVIGALL